MRSFQLGSNQRVFIKRIPAPNNGYPPKLILVETIETKRFIWVPRMRYKFKYKFTHAYNIIRAQLPFKLCYAMTVNKSQGQSYEMGLFDTTGETFSHGQTYVALSRIRYYNTIRLIVSDKSVIENDIGKYPMLLNCVYPSVILNNIY